jgi:hypothetical protein
MDKDLKGASAEVIAKTVRLGFFICMRTWERGDSFGQVRVSGGS